MKAEKFMNRGVTLALIASLLALFVANAAAQGFGHLGDRFGRLGANKGKGTAVASGDCATMDGTIVLTNTCNNIYLLTGVIR